MLYIDRKGSGEILMEIKRVIVPVATIWTSKDAPRKEDQLALTGDVKKWVSEMSLESSIDLADGNRLATQALFNDQVLVDYTEGGWAKVSVLGQPDDKSLDGYSGWVPTKLLGPEALTSVNKTTAEVKVAVKSTTLFDAQKQPLMDISMGTTFKQIAEEDNFLKVQTPFGSGFIQADSIKLPVVGGNVGETIVKMAEQYMGLRYLWAGISSYGFDCSGLTYNLHRVLEIQIPRDADDQSQNGMPVSPEELLPGDLLFFAYDHGTGYVHHVGIYMGNGQMIQSRTIGKNIDIGTLTEMRYAPELEGARRYWR